MNDTERLALKAACIQAAATLLAAFPPQQSSPPPPLLGGRTAMAGGPGPTPVSPTFGGRPAPAAAAATAEPDTAACARYARDLFHKLSGEVWD